MVKRKDFSVIKEFFKSNEYILKTIKYKNNRQKLEYICPEGHEGSVSWSDWKRGRRCPICAIKKGAKKRRKDFGIIKGSFENEGCVLITMENEYINCEQRLECICSNGHRHSISWHNWKTGWRCPYCFGNVKKTIDIIRDNFRNNGYVLKTVEYINNKRLLECVCPKGHEWYISWNNWSSKNIRCPYCSDFISQFEKEVKFFVSYMGIDYVANDRSILRAPDTNWPLELDIWVPQLNKAIECNGVYWHSSERKQFLDGVKQQFCEDLDIKLLVITDEEWNKNMEYCKNKIQSFLLSAE